MSIIQRQRAIEYRHHFAYHKSRLRRALEALHNDVLATPKEKVVYACDWTTPASRWHTLTTRPSTLDCERAIEPEFYLWFRAAFLLASRHEQCKRIGPRLFRRRCNSALGSCTSNSGSCSGRWRICFVLVSSAVPVHHAHQIVRGRLCHGSCRAELLQLKHKHISFTTHARALKNNNWRT